MFVLVERARVASRNSFPLFATRRQRGTWKTKEHLDHRWCVVFGLAKRVLLTTHGARSCRTSPVRNETVAKESLSA